MDGLIKRRLNKWVKEIVSIEKDGSLYNPDCCSRHIDRFVNNIPKTEWITNALEIKDYLSDRGLYSMVVVYITPRKKSGCIPRRFDISLLYDHLSDNIPEEDLYGIAPPNVYLSNTVAWSEEVLNSIFRTVLLNQELSSCFGRTAYSVEWYNPDEEMKYHYLRAIVFL